MVARLAGRPSRVVPSAERTLILFSAEHASNAEAPMLVRPSDTVRFDKLMESSNADSGRYVRLLGSDTRCTADTANTCLPILVTPSGTSMAESPCVP